MPIQYEHHIAIRQNPLCPFFLRVVHDLCDTVCNWHRNPELLLVTGGEGFVRYGTRVYPLREHDVVIVNPDSLHRIYSDRGIRYYCVIIDEKFCADNGLSKEQLHFDEHFRDPQVEELLRLVVAYLQENERAPSPLTIAKTRAAVLQLLIALCEGHRLEVSPDRSPAPRAEEYVKQALSYLESHSTEPLTLDEIAEAVGISKYHLVREFKKYTDQTIFTYLNRLRCKNAALLISEGKSVTQAALECGFESLPYFSRTYRRLMGEPPRPPRAKAAKGIDNCPDV